MKTPEDMADYNHGSPLQKIAAEYFKKRGITGPLLAYAENRFIDGYKAAQELRNSPEKLDGWISIKERLPAEEGEFLWCNRHSGICIISPMNSTWDGNLQDEYFTHWMPLPKPPEGE